nr:MAG TPA: hypothetical protein [Caudoviricetes sp.]
MFLQSYNPTIGTQVFTKVLIISEIRKLLHTKNNLQHLKKTSYTTYRMAFCRFYTSGRQTFFKSAISYNFLHRPTNLQNHERTKNNIIRLYIHRYV